MLDYLLKKKIMICSKKGELGIGTIIGIAIAIIIAGFVLIPGLRAFAQTVLDSMNEWWNTSVKAIIFPVS